MAERNDSVGHDATNDKPPAPADYAYDGFASYAGRAARSAYNARSAYKMLPRYGHLFPLQRDSQRLLRTPLRRQGFVPKVIVTDKLRSYGAALREIGYSGLHEQGLRANNRAENLISRFDDLNERCKASNQPNRLSALFPPTRPFTTRSTYNGI